MIRAGYDPYATLESIQVVRDHDNFGKLSGNKPTIYHGILGSHPAHTKRLNELISQSRGITYSDLELPEQRLPEDAIWFAFWRGNFNGRCKGWQVLSWDFEVGRRVPQKAGV